MVYPLVHAVEIEARRRIARWQGQSTGWKRRRVVGLERLLEHVLELLVQVVAQLVHLLTDLVDHRVLVDLHVREKGEQIVQVDTVRLVVVFGSDFAVQLLRQLRQLGDLLLRQSVGKF